MSIDDPIHVEPEVVGSPTPPPPPAYPHLSPEQARAEVAKAYEPGSDFWSRPDAQQRMLALLARAGQPSLPTPTNATGATTQPPAVEDARQQRIQELANDPRRLAGDPWLNDEYGTLLLGGPMKAPPAELPPERPPEELTDADLSPVTLPAGVSADDSAVREFREAAAYTRLPGPTVQAVVDRLAALLATEPLDEEQADVAAEYAIRAAEKRYGSRFGAMAQAAQLGQAIFSKNARIQEWLQDPRVANDPQVFAWLAELGRRSRMYYTRKHGTRRVAVQW